MVLNLLMETEPLKIGGYVSPWASLVLLLFLLIWGRWVTWVDKDVQLALLPRVTVNIGMMLGGVLAFALFFILPGFALALGVLVVLILIEVGVYLGIRHQKVGLGDLKQQFTNWINSFSGEKKTVAEVPTELQILNREGAITSAPPAESPDRPGHDVVQAVLADPLRRNAETLELMAREGAMACVYYVDGVAYSGRTIDKASAAAGIQFLKSVAGMDVKDRRKPQVGKVRVMIGGARKELQVQTSGSSTGEQLSVIVDPKLRHHRKLADLGMLPEQIAAIEQSVQERSGIVLVATPRGGGLTSTLYALIRAHDAFLNHIATVERAPDTDLEGITQNKLTANASPAEEAKQVAWVTSQQPDVILVTSIEDSRSAQDLIKFASEEGKRVYVGLRAATTFDAINAWVKIVGDPKRAMAPVTMVIAGRLIRRLCQACKVGYAPDPEQLRKLNLDPNRVTKLFQARKETMRDAKGNPVLCDFCLELHFKGRIGIYEILLVDDDMRATVAVGGGLKQMQAAFRRQKGKYMQEQALAQVQTGETSVEEVLRVLRSDTPNVPMPGQSPGAGTPRAPGGAPSAGQRRAP